MKKNIVNTPNAPAPIGPYSQAVRAGDWLFVSGQICIDPKTSRLNNATISIETKQIMDNLVAILTAANASVENIVKTTIFLSDMNLFSDVNEVYGSYFSADFPARETVAVKGLPKAVNVEISVIAIISKP